MTRQRKRTPLDAEAAQQVLPGALPPADMESRSRGGQVADYTGAGLFRRDPETYKRACIMLAEGATHSEISAELGITRNTVAGIWRAESQGSTLEQIRALIHTEYRTQAALARDVIRRMLTDDSIRWAPRDLAALTMAATQAEQAAELAAGGPTARVEHVAAAPTAEDFDTYIRTLPAAEVNRMDSSERGPAHSRDESATGTDAGGLEADQGEHGPAATSVAPDGVSDDGTPNTLRANGAGNLLRIEPQSESDSASDGGRDPAPGLTGGEGVANAQGGDRRRCIGPAADTDIPVSLSDKEAS